LYPCPAIGAGVLGSDDDVVVVVVVPVDVDTDVEVLVLAVVVAGTVVVEPVDVDVEPVAGTTVLVETVGVVVVVRVDVEVDVDTDVLVEVLVDVLAVVDVLGVVDGVGGPATTDVELEVSAVEPLWFEAVTITRSVLPTSPDESVYEEPPAPVSAQLPPPESHLSQSNPNFRPGPSQLPVLAESVLPTCVDPPIEGALRLRGGCCPGGPPADAPAATRSSALRAPTAGVASRRGMSLPSGGRYGPHHPSKG
jgi:hypothetical protein